MGSGRAGREGVRGRWRMGEWRRETREEREREKECIMVKHSINDTDCLIMSGLHCTSR